jgi:hypothetical protein
VDLPPELLRSRIHAALRRRDVRATRQHLQFMNRDATSAKRDIASCQIVPVQIDLRQCFATQASLSNNGEQRTRSRG